MVAVPFDAEHPDGVVDVIVANAVGSVIATVFVAAHPFASVIVTV